MRAKSSKQRCPALCMILNCRKSQRTLLYIPRSIFSLLNLLMFFYSGGSHQNQNRNMKQQNKGNYVTLTRIANQGVREVDEGIGQQQVSLSSKFS